MLPNSNRSIIITVLWPIFLDIFETKFQKKKWFSDSTSQNTKPKIVKIGITNGKKGQNYQNFNIPKNFYYDYYENIMWVLLRNTGGWIYQILIKEKYNRKVQSVHDLPNLVHSKEISFNNSFIIYELNRKMLDPNP